MNYFKKNWSLLLHYLNLDNTTKKIIISIVAILLFPLTFGLLFWWIILPVNKYITTKKRYFAFIAIFTILMICTLINENNQTPTTGYTRIYTTVENKETGEKVDYAIFTPIEVVKNDKSDFWDVYQKGKKIGQVQKTSIAFEGTPEYEQAKNEKAQYDKKMAEAKKLLEAKLKAERQKQLAELEKNINNVFYKIDFKQYSEDGNGTYSFYINPFIWAQLPFDQKENIFKNCTVYVQLKTNGTNSDFAKIGTKIKSSSNGSILAEYSPLSGIKLK